MDTVPAEIDEFYGYSEVHQFLENETNFAQHYKKGKQCLVVVLIADGSCKPIKKRNSPPDYVIDWQKSTQSEREAHAEFLLNFLDQKSDNSRLSVAHQLIYISQGTRRD